MFLYLLSQKKAWLLKIVYYILFQIKVWTQTKMALCLSTPMKIIKIKITAAANLFLPQSWIEWDLCLEMFAARNSCTKRLASFLNKLSWKVDFRKHFDNKLCFFLSNSNPERSQLCFGMLISTISLGTESRLSPKLLNNMSSWVPVPSLGHLFPKLE